MIFTHKQFAGWILVALSAAGGGWGCRNHRPATTQPVISSKPALELRKAVTFALDSKTPPANSVALSDAILQGLRKRLTLPGDRSAVQIESGDYPKLHRLVVDLTNALASSDRKLPRLQPKGPLVTGIHADEFQFTAQPLKFDTAKMFM